MNDTVLYLHGFLSSPQSHKACMTKKWFRDNFPEIDFICPHLSSYPRQAFDQIQEVTTRTSSDSLVVIGSSLGGYWATYIVEKNLARKAVLVNPAVYPYKRLNEFIDTPVKSFYSEEWYSFTQADFDFLESLYQAKLNAPEKYWLMVQTADETLDYREAVEKYTQSKQLIEEGGSHGFEGYEKWLPKICDFLI